MNDYNDFLRTFIRPLYDLYTPLYDLYTTYIRPLFNFTDIQRWHSVLFSIYIKICIFILKQVDLVARVVLKARVVLTSGVFII